LEIPSVILTSATLTTSTRNAEAAEAKSGPFSYIRRRFGISDELAVEEVMVDSPFDFQRNALLYTPKDLPPARSASFIDKAATRVSELVAMTEGGTLVLTTSLASMRMLHEKLRGRVGSRLLFLQGQAPKQALLSAFRAAGDAVLVATQSFWEGVDIPGRALRLVVLEKLPFSVPTDPIVKARALAIERDGGNAFMELFVPGAAISLKQGFGRLIRTRDDSGVVALLDERVHTKPYCRRLLRALPPVARTNELDDVARFWRDHSISTLTR
jgi:ATP-dependent DNA helicase DinG